MHNLSDKHAIILIKKMGVVPDGVVDLDAEKKANDNFNNYFIRNKFNLVYIISDVLTSIDKSNPISPINAEAINLMRVPNLTTITDSFEHTDRRISELPPNVIITNSFKQTDLSTTNLGGSKSQKSAKLSKKSAKKSMKKSAKLSKKSAKKSQKRKA